jgi:hypothetical protein
MARLARRAARRRVAAADDFGVCLCLALSRFFAAVRLAFDFIVLTPINYQARARLNAR